MHFDISEYAKRFRFRNWDIYHLLVYAYVYYVRILQFIAYDVIIFRDWGRLLFSVRNYLEIKMTKSHVDAKTELKERAYALENKLLL